MVQKPNLFIIGAPKCGTTAWYDYLGRHPDIAFSDAKEPHYFCNDFPKFRWAKNEKEYLKCFDGLPNKKYIGEASVMYLYSKVAVKNIREFNPDAKILIFIRHYEAFFQSYHSQTYLNHDEDELDLQKAWDLQDVRDAGQLIPRGCREKRFLQYRDVARFGEQINRVLELIPPEQVKVVVFEEWTRNATGTYADILNFLGVENDGFSSFKPVNTKRRDRNRMLGKWLHRPPKIVLGFSKLLRSVLGIERLNLARKLRIFNRVSKSSHQNLAPELAARIREYFRDDRILLEKTLGRKIVAWDKKNDIKLPAEPTETEPVS